MIERHGGGPSRSSTVARVLETRCRVQGMAGSDRDLLPEDADAFAGGPRPRRLPLGITLLGLAVCAYLLWDMRPAIAYWLSTEPAVDLGSVGAYQLDRCRDGIFARIEGVPGASASRFRRLGTRYEIVALRGTNVLVRRSLPPLDPATAREGREPPPDPARFSAQGRLVLDQSIAEYAQAFQHLVGRREVELREGHLYVLLDGDSPRAGWRVPAEALALAALALLNAAALARFALRVRSAGGAR
jgi:hypothetical protein